MRLDILGKRWSPPRASLRRDALVDAVAMIGRTFEETYHVAPDGASGWYRDLRRTDRVGGFATAQALICLDGGEQYHDAVRNLIGQQNADGGWSFVTGVAGRSTVDATAWVVRALHRSGSVTGAAASAEAGIAFLRRSCLSNGGWGMLPESEWRAYSTAATVQALVEHGLDEDARKGCQSLAAHVEPTTGAWPDSQGRLSVAVTSYCVTAINLVAAGSVYLESVRGRAQVWLCSTQVLPLWFGRSDLGYSTEGVEIRDPGQYLARVEYRYAALPMAIEALEGARYLDGIRIGAAAGLSSAALSKRVDGVPAQVGADDSASWAAFHTWAALESLDRSLPANWSEAAVVWGRTKVRGNGDGVCKWFLIRYWTAIAGLALAFLLLLVLNAAGIVRGLGLASLAFVVGSIALSVIANILSGLLSSASGRTR